MKTEIIPLGTASAMPTRDRHLASVGLRRKGRVLLFDCGEGTQMQVVRAGLSRGTLDAIFISHFHGDHFYGLFGLLSTLGLLKRDEPLTVVGPAGIREIVQGVPGLAEDDLPYVIDYVELAEDFEHETVFETDEVIVTARPLEHRCFCAGFRFEEKPRPGHLDPEAARARGATEHAHFRALKRGEAVTLENGTTVEPSEVVGPQRPGASFAYVIDTRPCAGGRKLAEGVDLLYHEATFGDEFQERAEETGHSTAREAAELAAAVGARRLLLGHFSARYDDPAPLAREAQAVFPDAEAAEAAEELRVYAVEAAAVEAG